MFNVVTRSTKRLFWFPGSKRLIYPPNASQITTKNRLYPTYFSLDSELSTILLTKDPLLLNFTHPGDKRCNAVTQALFDVLSDSKKYPLDASKSVELANVDCDYEGGRELMMKYAVGKVPSVVLLKKQMVQDRFDPPKENIEQSLVEWIKGIF